MIKNKKKIIDILETIPSYYTNKERTIKDYVINNYYLKKIIDLSQLDYPELLRELDVEKNNLIIVDDTRFLISWLLSNRNRYIDVTQEKKQIIKKLYDTTFPDNQSFEVLDLALPLAELIDNENNIFESSIDYDIIKKRKKLYDIIGHHVWQGEEGTLEHIQFYCLTLLLKTHLKTLK